MWLAIWTCLQAQVGYVHVPSGWGDALYRRDLPLDEMAAKVILEGGVCDSKVPLGLPLHAHLGFELHCFASGTMDVCLLKVLSWLLVVAR